MGKGISIERLETFKLVADAGGITPAAAGSKSRQAQFARQIKELEDYFHAHLVNRRSRNQPLTNDGLRLAEIAR